MRLLAKDDWYFHLRHRVLEPFPPLADSPIFRKLQIQHPGACVSVAFGLPVSAIRKASKPLLIAKMTFVSSMTSTPSSTSCSSSTSKSPKDVSSSPSKTKVISLVPLQLQVEAHTVAQILFHIFNHKGHSSHSRCCGYDGTLRSSFCARSIVKG